MKNNSSVKRLLSVLLASLTLMTVTFAACAEKPDSPASAEVTNGAVTEAETEAETELTRANTPDDLPSDLDFNGSSVTFLCRTKNWFKGEIHVDELDGEIVNDAVYQRDINVTERLNVDLQYVDKDDVTGAANTSISAAADDYQVVVGSAVEIVQYGAKGQYFNLIGSNVEYLNTDQPWWAQYYTEQANVGGKVFFITGDAGWSLRKLAFVTYFNKNMVETYNIKNPYDMVADGSWTIDNFATLVSGVYSDVNGNGKSDKDDIFGFGCGNCINFDVYWSAFDLTLVSRDENNDPYLDVNVDKFQSAVDKTYDLFYNNVGTTCWNSHDGDKEQDELAEKFSADQLLITTLRIMGTDLLRDMESDYGIIPCPKWDEVQDNYYTFVHDQYSVFGIPITVADTPCVSATLEAFAADSYRNVTPAYYDIVLNGKYLRDAESSQMLELALNNVKIDFTWIYTYNMSSAAQNTFRYLMSGGSTDFTSYLAKYEKTYNKNIEKLVTKFAELDD